MSRHHGSPPAPPRPASPDRRDRPHVALRPIWLCRVCAAPWPCGTARLELRREYVTDPVALRIYLCTLLHDAVADLYQLNPHDGPDPRDLFRRFLAWAPRIGPR
ncbi:hypothetical protein [Micromonospora costi]|uniref:hypothetical protein n=1 Tax=Micromonospora costi TaxID=1530042 RepID=UPI0015772DC2|nr:hypothetical protein [Micromonospora costi]